MATRSKNAIVRIIKSLRDNPNISGVVNVKSNDDDSIIDINFDNRKYIGRLRLEWQRDRYAVYLMDKAQGKLDISELHATKSVYLLIKTAPDARKFVKWYEIITELAALARNRT